MDNELPLPPESSVNIELEDLKELARINPLAWEQLVHIADNRKSNKMIKDLTEQLQDLGKTSKNLVDIQKEMIESKSETITELEEVIKNKKHAKA